MTHAAPCRLLALIPVLCATTALAQAPAPPAATANTEAPVVERIMTTTVPLLERNTFSQPFPNNRIGSWFEGMLAVHLPLLDSYTNSLDSAWQHHQRTASGHAVVVSMLVNLRMTRESSAPVRTPSYMPRLRYVHSRTRREQQSVRQWLFDGTVGHYSNGQDGCLYQGQSGEACAFATPMAVRDRRTNRRDGSFSSHYLEAGITRRWIRMDDANFSDDRVRARTMTHVGMRVRDYSLMSGIGGGMVDELREAYGNPPVRLQAGRTWESNRDHARSGSQWLDGFVEFLPSRAPQVDPIRIVVEYGRSFDAFRGAGFFVRAYSGRDDYNLGFLTNLRVVHLGIAMGGEGRPSFRQ